MKTSRSYLRSVGEGARSGGAPLLRPPAVRVWPLQPMSGYEAPQTPHAEAVQPMLPFFCPPSASLTDSGVGKKLQPRHAYRQINSTKLDDGGLDARGSGNLSLEDSVLNAAITGQSAPDDFRPGQHKSKVLRRPGIEAGASTAQPVVETEQKGEGHVLHLSSTTSRLSTGESLPQESRSELREGAESSIADLVPEKARKHGDMIALPKDPQKKQRKSTPVELLAERSSPETGSSRPRLPDSAKPPEDVGTRSLPAYPKDVPQSTTAQTARPVQPHFMAADHPAATPRTPTPMLFPQGRSVANTKLAYPPALHKENEKGGPRNTVHIGTIDIHIAPAPPPPAPRPSIRQSPASPVSALARGFTPDFGFRQG